jgi:hypothetical protein
MAQRFLRGARNQLRQVIIRPDFRQIGQRDELNRFGVFHCVMPKGA